MKKKEDARALARAMVDIGNAMGKPTRALLTAMDQPLGRAVGNALEVAESVACLKGEGPADLMEVTYALGAEMLCLAKVAKDAKEGRAMLETVVANGAALAKFKEIVVAQGGDARVCDEPMAVMTEARLRGEVRAAAGGYVQSVDAMTVALAALRLGAGRVKAEDAVDHAVGFTQLVKIGERVQAGDVLAVVHANDEAKLAAAQADITKAVVIGDTAVTPVPLIDSVIG
jgi:pyrimidine-nucleoside phosphorylase